MEHYNLEKDIASDLKEQFELECPNFADGGTQHKTCRTLWTVARHSTADSRYGPTWHCLVGRHFLQLCWEPWQLSQLYIGIPSAKDEHLLSLAHLHCLRSRTKRAAIATWTSDFSRFFLAALECFELRVKSQNY